MLKRISVVLIAVVLGCGSAQAEDDFANHVDLFPLTVSNHYSMLAEAGYHFTLWRAADRIEFGGLGLVLDAADEGDRTSRLNFIGTLPVASVALRKPKGKDWWLSFGVQYGYNFNRHRSMLLVGFSAGFH